MVNIPPLLCSTPPPIDFGEEEEEDDCKVVNVLALADDVDDDEDDDDVGIRNDNNYNKLKNNKNKHSNEVHSYMSSPTNGLVMDAGAFITNITPPPLDEENMDHNSRVKNDKMAPVEAINLHVSGVDYDVPSLNDNDNVERDEREQELLDKSQAETFNKLDNEIIEDVKEITNDVMVNVIQPSVRDNNENVAENSSNSQLLFNQVSLEDVEDDNELPININNNNNNIVIDEQSADYFAIHILADSTQKPTANETATTMIPKDTTDNPMDEVRLTDRDAVIEPVHEVTTSPMLETEHTKSNKEFIQEFEADFNAFADTAIEQSVETSEPTNSEQLTKSEDKEEVNNEVAHSVVEDNVNSIPEDDADDFDDFQDFTWHEPTVAPQTYSADNVEEQQKVQTSTADNVEDDDFADDFGDFEEATFTPAPAIITKTSSDTITPHSASNNNNTTALLNLNLGTIKANVEPVLKMMFPAVAILETPTNNSINESPSSSSSNSLQTSLLDSQLDRQSKIELQSIDSARALQYQWAKSTGRYALIKSLGIDARNVLFGEKWSKPIFAADLTSLPLKPINYQTTIPVAATTATSNSVDDAILNANESSIDIGSEQVANTEPSTMQPQHLITTTLSDDGLLNSFDQKYNVADASLDMMCTTNYNNAHEPDDINLESSTSGFHSIENKFNSQMQQLSFDVTSPNTMERTLTPTEHHTQHSQILNAYDTTTNSSFDFDIMDIESKTMPTLSFNNKSINDFDMQVRSTSHSSGASSSISASSNNSPIATTTMDSYVTNYNNNSLSVTSIAYDTMSDIDEVIVTSTYSGPLKETHIYTPPKANAKSQPQQPVTLRTASPTKVGNSINAISPIPNSKTSPIDFDYVMASVGIVIDETVVKKEYRDIEYNPEFDVQSNSEPFEVVDVPTAAGTPTNTSAVLEAADRTASSTSSAVATPSATNSNSSTTGEWDDDFTEFQSAPLPQQNNQFNTSIASPAHKSSMLQGTSMPGTPSRGIILSPAILIPQALHTEQKKPTNIEWGVPASNINPDELARIEALFSQNKNHKPVAQSVANDTSSTSSSQRTTPKHTSNSSNDSTSFSISATIASKERRQQNFDDDDDDWSEFVYVPVAATPKPTNATTTPIYNSNNSYIGTTLSKQVSMPVQGPMQWTAPSALQSPGTSLAQQQQQQQQQQYSCNNPYPIHTNNFYVSNDDEWSDFVSSNPTAPAAAPSTTTQSVSPPNTTKLSPATSHLPQQPAALSPATNTATSNASVATTSSSSSTSPASNTTTDAVQFSIFAQYRSL